MKIALTISLPNYENIKIQSDEGLTPGECYKEIHHELLKWEEHYPKQIRVWLERLAKLF